MDKKKNRFVTEDSVTTLVSPLSVSKLFVLIALVWISYGCAVNSQKPNMNHTVAQITDFFDPYKRGGSPQFDVRMLIKRGEKLEPGVRLTVVGERGSHIGLIQVVKTDKLYGYGKRLWGSSHIGLKLKVQTRKIKCTPSQFSQKDFEPKEGTRYRLGESAPLGFDGRPSQIYEEDDFLPHRYFSLYKFVLPSLSGQVLTFTLTSSKEFIDYTKETQIKPKDLELCDACGCEKIRSAKLIRLPTNKNENFSKYSFEVNLKSGQALRGNANFWHRIYYRPDEPSTDLLENSLSI